jgi:hypothetical protein
VAIYRLPPSPFVGGRQPLAPKDFNPAVGEIPPVVDDPPPNRRFGVLAAIFIAWTPIDAPIQPQKFVPTTVAEHVPQGRHPESINQALASWYAPYKVPFRPKQIAAEEAPDVPTVDDAPVSASRLYIILSNWEEKLSFIQIKPFVPIVEEAVDTGEPWLRPQLYITIEPYYPTFRRNLQIVEGAAPVVDNPPFGQRIWLKTILDAWTPPPFDFIKPIQIPHEFIPAPVDDPPFGRRVLWLNTVLDAWIPPPPEPWNPIVHITPPPSGDIIIWMWKRVS